MTVTALEAEGIEVRFGARRVLADVSLALARGERVGLVGENGAGKSTLLGVLSGALLPRRGRVRLEGRPLGRAPPAARARAGLASAFQGEALAPSLSPRAHFELAEADFRSWAERLELRSDADRPVRDLDRGVRRRLGLGLALARAPRVLLLDEPFAGLAPSSRAGMLAALDAAREAGTAVLWTEHELSWLEARTDRVVVLEGGALRAKTEDDRFSPPQNLAKTEDDRLSPPQNLAKTENDRFSPPTDIAKTETDRFSPPTDIAKSGTHRFSPPTDIAKTEDDRFSPPQNLAKTEDDRLSPPQNLAKTENDRFSPPTDIAKTGTHGFSPARGLFVDLELTLGGGERVRLGPLTVGPGETRFLPAAGGPVAAALLGLHPARGRIELDGRPLPEAADARRRAGLAGVLDPPRLVPDLSLASHLQLARAPAEARALLSRFLPGAGAERFEVPAGAASGGERRLLALALALAGSPRVLALEEVLTGVAQGAEAAARTALAAHLERGGAVLFLGPSAPPSQAWSAPRPGRGFEAASGGLAG